jgi:hypothetical protein
MPKNKTIDAILAEAEQIARVWANNPTFSLGELTLAQLQAKIASLRAKQTHLQDLRTQVTAATNDTNTEGDDVNALITRVRSGIRAVFGPDSNQYEQAGGTRQSERKRTTRKPKPDGSGSK